SGRASLNPSKSTLVCSNLYDGFDLYDLVSRQYIRTITTGSGQTNVAVMSCFAEQGGNIVLGSSVGRVKIVSAHDDGDFEVLDHGVFPKSVINQMGLI
ncbi:hypothetical protein FA13DRAFT_1641027, partial [Coprinellus micaceus]